MKILNEEEGREEKCIRQKPKPMQVFPIYVLLSSIPPLVGK
jgi:hypothetical protein